MAELLADLGNPPVALSVLVAAVAYALVRGGARRWLAPLYAVAGLGCAAVVVSVLKVWLGRPGPTGGINYYPSGHTATAAVAFGGAALVLSMSARRPPLRPLLVTAGVLTLLCGAGLIWRGYHWPLDVLASLCLGWMILASATALSRRGLRHGPPEEPGG